MEEAGTHKDRDGTVVTEWQVLVCVRLLKDMFEKERKNQRIRKRQMLL